MRILNFDRSVICAFITELKSRSFKKPIKKQIVLKYNLNVKYINGNSSFCNE